MAGVWKRDGTVAVTNGSKKVTGTGTTFADAKNGVAKGHLFCMTTGTTVDLYEVDYVVSNTELHLVQAFRGTTGTGKAYEIITTFSDSIPEFARKLNASLSYYQSQSDMVQQLFTSDAAEITVTAPDGTTHKLIPWKRVTSDGEGQAARAKVEADRSKIEADRSGTEADRAAGIVAAAALPMPDVWAPLSDSLRMITGYGRDVLVGSDVVARMVNFSRNSTATYIGKDGLLKTAAANEPRFEKEGLLIEGQSTNLIPTSAALTTQTLSVQAGTHTLSFYGTGSVSLSGAATGAITGTGAGNRVALTFTATAGNITLTITGVCNNGQLEALPFASSYIPTNGAAVTRAADVCWIPMAGNSNNRMSFALTISGFKLVGASVNSRALWYETDTAGPYFGIRYRDGEILAAHGLVATGTAYASGLSGLPASVIAISPGVTSRVGKYTATQKADSATLQISSGNLHIGSFKTTGQELWGHVRNLRIWHRALTEDQLKAVA
ncbi:TPA: hypothetical protein ACSCXL_000294 [Aeromonas veronii]